MGKRSQDLKKKSTKFNFLLSCGPIIKIEQKSLDLQKATGKIKGNLSDPV